MTDLPTEFPETHGALYDLLQQWFGIGNYDDVVSRMAWHKARMGEISRLKALCRSRKATPRQVAIAAWYARDRGIQIRATHRLFPLIPEAMRAFNEARAAVEQDQLTDELSKAISEAIEAGQQDWADRLLRADVIHARSLLNEWRAER